MLNCNALPFARSPKLLVVIVAGFSDSEKVSTTTAFSPIPVAAFCGVTMVTSGTVVFVPVPVVNVLEKALLALPERSSRPVVTCRSCRVQRIAARQHATDATHRDGHSGVVYGGYIHCFIERQNNWAVRRHCACPVHRAYSHYGRRCRVGYS